MGSLKSSSACRRLKEIKQWSIYWVTGLRKAPDSDTNPAASALPCSQGRASLGLCCALGVKHRSRTLPAPALCHWEHKQLFHFLSAKQHLLQWQLQRPSMTLNNNRKLNQRICRGIQSFPFHHRLQRPFLLQGSQEYAGQASNPLLWPSLFPQTEGCPVLPLAKWIYNPGAWFGPQCCIQGNTGSVQTSFAFERPGELSHLLCTHFHQILPNDSTKKFSGPQ